MCRKLLFLVFLVWSHLDHLMLLNALNPLVENTFLNDPVENSQIFWNKLSDDEMMNFVKTAEKQLKIFIYPIPSDAETDVPGEQLLAHFRTEYLFRKYLQELSTAPELSSDDPRRVMIVSDPNQANAFVIDHNWMKLTRHRCGEVTERHLIPIITNVLENYPFFKRSQGRDHFFMAVYDKGPFCDMQCFTDDTRRILDRIVNVSFIGNYGMDMQTYYDIKSTENRTLLPKYEKSGPCHRSQLDIVIPQMIIRGMTVYHKFYKTKIPYRQFDSTFTGASWGERKPVEEMAVNAIDDYKEKGLDRFSFYVNGNPDYTLIYRGYYMWAPCGFACWSQRLFESLAHYTIPILANSGSIQAFERFIDWTKISVKMSLETWNNKTRRDDYRKLIRKEAFKFRSDLLKCWQDLNVPIPKSTSTLNQDHRQLQLFTSQDVLESGEEISVDSRQWDETWLNATLSRSNKHCGALQDTMIWQKALAMQRVVPWINFDNVWEEKNAFRLLTLELWCHALPEARQSSVCNRPPDYTARLEYFK